MAPPFIGTASPALPSLPSSLIAFHRFADTHRFAKPNDTRGLELMDHSAITLMRQHPDIILGFGQSDEYRYPYLSQANPSCAIPSIVDQFSSAQRHDAVQQTAIKNHVHFVFPFHSGIRDELAYILPREPPSLPTFL